MSKKCKFDPQWEQALSLLSPDDAAKAREVIETYQTTGIMPKQLEPRFEMILLLVQPTIDRRRRAAAQARIRRQRLMETKAQQISAALTTVKTTDPLQQQVPAEHKPIRNQPQPQHIRQANRHRRRKLALRRKRQAK